MSSLVPSIHGNPVLHDARCGRYRRVTSLRSPTPAELDAAESDGWRLVTIVRMSECWFSYYRRDAP